MARYYAAQERHRRVAQVLGIEWPPKPHHSIRPFAWFFETPPAVDRAIAYPHDWRRPEYADLYGVGRQLA